MKQTAAESVESAGENEEAELDGALEVVSRAAADYGAREPNSQRRTMMPRSPNVQTMVTDSIH